jgi:uncharacterized protein YrrD
MRGRSGDELMKLPVRLRGIQLGHAVDLLVDLPSDRVLGFEVRCGDDAHRFLPVSAVTVRDDELSVSSALTMLEEAELEFYRGRAASLSTLRGRQLLRAQLPVGRLRDVVVAAGGAVQAILVDDGTEVPASGGFTLAPAS